jgi:5'-3' exonuclease
LKTAGRLATGEPALGGPGSGQVKWHATTHLAVGEADGARPHLVDGTYELFRHYYGAPAHRNAAGEEVGATRAALGSLLGMLEGGVRYLGVATDHVIESFRNDLWSAYKSSEGVPVELLGQFGLFEEALDALGLAVWPMTDLEADDALASAAAVLSELEGVAQVVICTPDKDLGQCVRGRRVVCLDRRKGAVVDEDAVRARFGVGPASVPDWLALVGDSSDGYPGLPGWGPRAATAVLRVYERVEDVPMQGPPWPVPLPAGRLATLRSVLAEHYEEALLFKQLATCVVRSQILPCGQAALDALRWAGPHERFSRLCGRVEAPELARRANLLAERVA